MTKLLKTEKMEKVISYRFELKENHDQTFWWKNGGKKVWSREASCCIAIGLYQQYGKRFLESLNRSGDWREAVNFEIKELN